MNSEIYNKIKGINENYASKELRSIKIQGDIIFPIFSIEVSLGRLKQKLMQDEYIFYIRYNFKNKVRFYNPYMDTVHTAIFIIDEFERKHKIIGPPIDDLPQISNTKVIKISIWFSNLKEKHRFLEEFPDNFIGYSK